MKGLRRSIFRDEAVRRYVEGSRKSVLPRLVFPHTFIYLWFLLGLLGMSSIVTWFTRVPIYASGSAVVVRWQSKKGTPKDIVVAAFFPPQYLSSLQMAQKLFLRFDAIGVGKTSWNENRLSRSIIAIKPEIVSPNSIQQQFALNSEALGRVTQPAAVVIAQLEPIPTGLPASTYLGSVGSAQIEVGSQRTVSLLPFIGQFFAQ